MHSRAESSPSHLYVPQHLGGAGESLLLSAEESHYVSRVCRARAGDEVTGTDGRGTIATLRVMEPGKAVRVQVVRVRRLEPPRRAEVWCGAPEGQRADWLVEKLAELGVAVFQPIECERAAWSRGPERGDRWQRLAVAALRQSRRGFLMEVREPAVLDAAIETVPGQSARWLADPEGRSGYTPGPGREPEVAVIGPSSGLSVTERDSLVARGFQPIRLSDGRLRTETAALAWAARWAGAA